VKKGQLKSWNEGKGFGFIQSDSLERDIFVHISSLKSMSRKPIVGDIIYFDVEIKSDGKTCAINCGIEGVRVIKNNSNKHQPKKKTSLLSNVISVTIVLLIGFFGYQQLMTSTSENSNYLSPSVNADPKSAEKIYSNYSCDGRQHCSQMTSRQEAEYFIKHCPDTKMDGDHDGIPCENDSRF
jgi:cold shock CspA family protein